ncbi:MAG TPA: type VII secretion target [Actinocatenispora sp.]
MTADRFEVDTDQLRSAAARLADIGNVLGAPTEHVARTGDPAPPPPAELLGDTGLTGWSAGAALAHLGEHWDASVRGLAAEYSDHADQLRAAADRYDDAERLIERTLRGTGDEC